MFFPSDKKNNKSQLLAFVKCFRADQESRIVESNLNPSFVCITRFSRLLESKFFLTLNDFWLLIANIYYLSLFDILLRVHPHGETA
jgi:hypothetical protein